MKKADGARFDLEEAYILHSYPFRETSLIIEAFSARHGRVALVARGAKRPRSAFRGLLLSFQPLVLSWFGKNELKTLHKAEWNGGKPRLQGMALICGLYLNELLMRLLPRDDAHETLYSNYSQTLEALGGGRDPSAVLRRFEVDLLKELGWGLMLERDAETGEPLSPNRVYTYKTEKGPVLSSGHDALRVSGKTLLDMASGDYSDPVTQQQSKALMRMLISHYLGEEPLYTRRLIQDLQTL